VLGVAAILVTRANAQIARETIEQDLVQGERVFRRLLAQNQVRLQQGAAILSADFAFRQAIATHDAGTILSVLRNHGARAGAAAMMLVSLEGQVRADTQKPERAGKPFAFPALLQEAAPENRAASMVRFDGQLYQLVVVPVLAPEPIAWVALAFDVDDRMAAELRELTELEVSFLSRPHAESWRTNASTLAPELRAALAEALAKPAAGPAREFELGGEPYEARVSAFTMPDGAEVAAVLQRPLAVGLRPFRRIDAVFTGLAVASLAFLVVGSVLIAREITRPLARLAEAARRIQQGDYANPVERGPPGEIGELAQSFNHMLEGIRSREKEILRLAYEDGLTGLPNRAMFMEQLEQSVRRARRSGESVAVMLLDLDRFKAINETLGHPVGDQALGVVAGRVRAALRESDVVARLGGDEFAVLLETGDTDRSGAVAAKIARVLEAPIVVEGQSMDLSASIGIARFPEHGEDASALLRSADVAMYAAKRDKTGVGTYDPGHDERRQEHLTLLGELRRAVEADELVLYYQPKVSIAAGATRAVEALVRWRHPTRGFVAPADFIAFAEQTGYIGAITRRVVDRAVAQCGRWRRAGADVRVSVNVSARDLRDGAAFCEAVAAALREHGVPAALLCLEITESALMEDPRGAQATLARLRELGIAASIDDYGTGYSSLAYIKQLAVSELKIDRTFVSGMEADARNAAIVRSTIELGHNLGLTVVAEGVETGHELEELRRFGCDAAQGYHFARPMPAEELDAWWRGRPEPAGARA